MHSRQYWGLTAAERRAINRDLYLKNRDAIRANSRAWAERNPEKRLWQSAQQRAKREGAKFSILPTDIKIPTHCPILGIPINCALGRGRPGDGPSLDRVNPAVGYVPGNVQIISDMANRMKQNANKAELILFAKWVLRTFGE